jgi:glutaredoxin-related protein
MVIEIASMPDCPWCALAEHDLMVAGFNPTVHVLDSPVVRADFKTTHGTETFPQVFVDHTRIGGYQEVKQWLAGVQNAA